MAEKKGKKKNSAKKLISGLFAKKKTNKPTQNGRKKTKNSRRETIIIVVLTLLAVGAVVFFAARSFGGMKYNDVEDSAKQLISASGTGAGYPYKISSADVLDMTPFKSNIALLTRDSVVVLNSSAKEVARLEHNYSDPDMAVYKGRALVYDRTSGDFTLMNSSKILGDGNTGSPIYTAAMGKDGRISPKFLHPGPGYGGSCFPKDTKALADTGKKFGAPMTVVESVVLANQRQKKLAAEKIMRRFPDGGVIALLGLSFKPETDDIRESPAVEIAGALLADGRYTVRMYDPKALENARRQLGGQANAVWCGSKKEALDNADAVVIATEWSEFASMDLAALGSSLRQPVLFDLRNVYRKSEAETAGLEYYGTGV